MFFHLPRRHDSKMSMASPTVWRGKLQHSWRCQRQSPYMRTQMSSCRAASTISKIEWCFGYVMLICRFWQRVSSPSQLIHASKWITKMAMMRQTGACSSPMWSWRIKVMQDEEYLISINNLFSTFSTQKTLGQYECQLNTEPKMKLNINLMVKGELPYHNTFEPHSTTWYA